MAEIKRHVKARSQPLRRNVHYAPDEIRAAFAEFHVGAEGSDGEQRAFCPLCEDPAESSSPSAMINVGKGVWHCKKSEHEGFATTIAGLVEGYRHKHPSFKITASSQSGTVKKTLRRPTAIVQPPPLPKQEMPLYFHDRLMAGERPDLLEFLQVERGLTTETIQRFKIGTDGHDVTYPVRWKGKWVNVRYYTPHAKKNKIRSTPPDGDGPKHGTAVLYPVEALAGNILPVLLCEGEADALLANQLGEGEFVAVTGTGGARTAPKDLSPLLNREVFVAYDLDDAGREGAQKIAEKLRALGITTYVLDLERAGLRSAALNADTATLPGAINPKGADVTDYFMHAGGTVEKLVAEMDRLREQGELDEDDPLPAIERAFLATDDVSLEHLAEGLDDDQIAALPSPTYAVEGWFPNGFFSLIYGAPGAMKTFAILDACRSVRAGADWLGYPAERSAVLLYEGEGLPQLRDRNEAWDLHHGSPDLAPTRSFERFVDLTTPEGVASVVRTVRAFENTTGERVGLVAFDPAVEYMTGDENGEGSELLSRGLRALAQYLDIAVLVGHHSNASGDRARGSEHLRMRSGAYIRMEELDNGDRGIVQQKQKNGEQLAVIVQPVPTGASLALHAVENMTAAEYHHRKNASEMERRAATKLSGSKVERGYKDARAAEWIVEAVGADPGITKTVLLSRLLGRGVGSAGIDESRRALLSDGTLRSESGPRGSEMHYLVGTEKTSK